MTRRSSSHTAGPSVLLRALCLLTVSLGLAGEAKDEKIRLEERELDEIIIRDGTPQGERHKGDIVWQTDEKVGFRPKKKGILREFTRDQIVALLPRITLQESYEREQDKAGTAPARHYQLALACLEHGLEKEYVDELKTTVGLDKDRKHLEAYFKLGDYYRGKDDRNEELRVYQGAIEKGVSDCQLLLRLGTMHKELGLIDWAIKEYLGRVAKEEPNNREAFEQLGEALRLAGRLDEAMEKFDYILRSWPDSAPAHYGRGLILFEQRRRDEAAKCFERAKKGSKLAGPHYYLGVIAASDRELDAAAKHFQAALKIDPNYHEARADLGLVYLRTGKPKEGVEEIKKAAKHAGAYVSAHLAQGYVSERAGDASGAVKSYEAALQQDPGNVYALCGLGRAHLAASRLPQAKDAYEKALAVDPGSKTARRGIGLVALRLRDYERALDCFTRITSGPSPSASDLLRLAMVYLQYPGDMFQRGAEALAGALRRAPEDGHILAAMAYVYYNAGDVAQAVTIFRQAEQHEAVADYARQCLAAINQAESETYEDFDFRRPNGPTVGDMWQEDEPPGAKVCIAKNAAQFEWRRDAAPAPAVLKRRLQRQGTKPPLVRYEVEMDISWATKALVGIELATAVGIGRLQLAKDQTGALVYRHTGLKSGQGGRELGEWRRTLKVAEGSTLVLGIEFLDRKTGRCQLLVGRDRQRVDRPLTVSDLAGVDDFELCIFGQAAPAQTQTLRVSRVRLTRRQEVKKAPRPGGPPKGGKK